MNERIEREMARTISLLQASMPEPAERPASLPVLLRAAAGEMSVPLLLALPAGALLFGTAAARAVSMPMLASFCTAPLPMLLLFHRYVLDRSDGIRELESTLRYAYAEMAAARALLLSGYMLVWLLALSGALHLSAGADFLRLALCGAVPSLYLCALLLFLAGRVHSQTALSAMSAALWTALGFFSVVLGLDRLLELCSTGLYAALAAGGVLLYAACARAIRTRRYSYGFGMG